MRKWTHILTLLTLIITTLTGCNRENPAFNRENIKAPWIIREIDNEDASVEQTRFFIFDDEGNVVFCSPVTQEDGVKWEESSLYYFVDCCTLEVFTAFVSGLYGINGEFSLSEFWDITDQKDSTLTISLIERKIDEELVNIGIDNLYLEKIHNDKSLSGQLKGRWGLVQLNEEIRSDFRIEFTDDTNFHFYVETEDGGWQIKSDNAGYFNIYDDYLCLTQFNNLFFGQQDKWSTSVFKTNIDLEQGTMSISNSTLTMSFVILNN